MSRKIAFRKKRQNRLGMFLVSTVVIMLLGVVTFKNVELLAKQQTYEARELALTSEIEEENQRTEELAEYEKYTKTNKFVEEIAREKLGLVYKNEIVFKEKE